VGLSSEIRVHLSVDDVKNLEHRNARSAEVADHLDVEAPLAVFPEEDEVGGT